MVISKTNEGGEENMKFKKLTSLMLVTAVTASMLAGCGGGSNEVSSTNSTGDNSSASAGGVKRTPSNLPEMRIRRLPSFLISSRCPEKK